MAVRIMMVCLAALVLPVVAPAAAAPSDNDRCLTCHGSMDIVKNKGGGRLYVEPGTFSSTAHALVGCASCHDSVTAGHPQDGAVPVKAGCGECHAPVQAEYAKSLHGGRATCNDCHNPHEARPALAVSGKYINSKCAKCHDMGKTVKNHAKWLPQADLHIDAIPCITCHTGSKNYVITMFIEIKQPVPPGDFKTAEYPELAALRPIGGTLSRLVDKNGDGFISLAELREFNREARGKGMRLWGMMTPETVTHTYQILGNRWDCSFCHASGPKAMQTSYVAFPDKNGGITRLAVEKGAILDILYGTPDFYMLGATRSSALNIVGALIIAGGMMMPVGHGTLRFLTRKNRKEH
ncbi:cytochrome C [Geobacter sp. FeAm09]|uniref:cytochrome C n=1 Tax=Geobacter sp. FeAm09 TaxID=2597769 RepID=UPI0011ED4EA1|nr:cytochrome C [Geobacter sp. FeAm09]QEM67660.1 cytochrome C [Geobacter sp. FeAm09]